MVQKPRILAVTGPTACGKTALAVALARRFDGEIVSVDSRQVYRGMDLGTGKDLEEYGEIPYHLIDVAEPSEIYDLARFSTEAAAAVAAVCARGKLPILCGGTALYLDAFLRRYDLDGPAPDPALRAELDALDMESLRGRAAAADAGAFAECAERNSRPRLRRIVERALLPPTERASCDFDALVLGVYFPRSEVRARIGQRLDDRFRRGMTAEVETLIDRVGLEKVKSFGLEYREIARFLAGECSEAEMRSTLLNKIRQFAKRQDIFFRKMERAGIDIYWLTDDREAAAAQLTEAFLNGATLPPPQLRMSETFYPGVRKR